MEITGNGIGLGIGGGEEITEATTHFAEGDVEVEEEIVLVFLGPERSEGLGWGEGAVGGFVGVGVGVGLVTAVGHHLLNIEWYCHGQGW